MVDCTTTIRSAEEYQSVFNKAEQLRVNGQIQEAADAYRHLLCYRLQWEEGEPGLKFTRNEFIIVDRLADISLILGNKKAVRHLLSALEDLTNHVRNWSLRIHVVTKLLLLNLHDSNLDDAIENARSLTDVIGNLEDIQISQAGLPLWESRVHLDPDFRAQDRADQFVCLYDALSALLLAFGRFAEGIVMLQRGIQIGQNNRSPLVDSRLLAMKLFKVKALYEKGEIQLAKTALAETENDARAAEIASGTPLELLEIQSKLALAQGELGQAYNCLFRVMQYCQGHRLVLAELYAHYNLAQTKILLNQVDEAAIIFQDCLLKAEKLGEAALALRIKRFLQVADKKVQTVLPVLNYAASRRKPKPAPRPKAAPVEESLDYHRPESYLGLFEEKVLIFQMQLAENLPDKAAETLTQLHLLAGRCDSAFVHARLQIAEFTLLYFTNASIPADWPFQPVLDFLTANQLLPELWQFRRLLSHTELVSQDQKDSWTTENQHILDHITATLPPTMQALYLLNKWSSNEEYLAGFSNELYHLKQKATYHWFWPQRWLTGWKLMKRLHPFQEDVKRYQDHLARNIASGTKSDGFAFSDFGSGLLNKLLRQPRGSLSITYLVLPDRIVITSRSFLQFRVHITFINRVTLRQLVFALRDLLYPEGKFKTITDDFFPSPQPYKFAELLTHLSNMLQADNIFQVHGNSIKHITFVADDVLHGFPFTVLNLGGTNILEKVKVSISTDDRQPKQEKINFSGRTALIMGVSEAVLNLPPLPGVLREAAQINESLTNYGTTVQLLLNGKATIEEAKKQLPATSIAHFSCHGKFDFRHPEQSGLVLASAEMLTLKDILSLQNLSQLQLLVLSSCRGAEHFILPGRWIIGLPETFSRAGVRTILAFLWPVDDDFATCFTTRFYEHLKTETPAEAFRLTVLRARNKQLPGLQCQYWEPKFWAGAVFYER
ncbi:MAG: CHAT domain-containing protein [Williamsia sp.]|nr:CHAT domain-containing protein [Williamsia sp.]